MPAKSIKQQRFMGMVRRAQKTGQASSPEVAEVAASMKKKDVKDYASTKHKGLPMKKEEFINEEDYDRMKDRRMERGGVGGNQRPNFASGPKKSGKKYDGMKALDMVKAEIRKKHGKGAIMGESKKDCVKADKKTMHNCAKKVCSEQWGVGECIYGQHAIPDAEGNVAWYDVMFEHGIEKGVDVSTLEVLEEGSHGEHVEHQGQELTEKKKDETNIGGGNLKKLAKKATKRVDSNVDGTVNSSDMKDSDVGEFVPGPTGGKVKTKARFENWRSDMPPLVERTMTAKDKKKEDRLKDKYDDSEMKQNMIDKYGKEEGEKIYYATIRKQAMKEEIDKRRAPAELVARLSAKREGHMAQDGPNKAAYDAKQRLLAKSKAKRVDEAKFFPNAEDPFGSTDKLKKVKRPGTIKNKGAGYKEGQALKQTIMKKEGRMGKVESQKDKLRKRGKLLSLIHI